MSLVRRAGLDQPPPKWRPTLAGIGAESEVVVKSPAWNLRHDRVCCRDFGLVVPAGGAFQGFIVGKRVSSNFTLSSHDRLVRGLAFFGRGNQGPRRVRCVDPARLPHPWPGRLEEAHGGRSIAESYIYGPSIKGRLRMVCPGFMARWACARACDRLPDRRRRESLDHQRIRQLAPKERRLDGAVTDRPRSTARDRDNGA
jgi:hypothetical protein